MDRAIFTPPFLVYRHGAERDVLGAEVFAQDHRLFEGAKCPGWIRLCLPVVLSLGLWAPLILAFRTLS